MVDAIQQFGITKVKDRFKDLSSNNKKSPLSKELTRDSVFTAISAMSHWLVMIKNLEPKLKIPVKNKISIQFTKSTFLAYNNAIFLIYCI